MQTSISTTENNLVIRLQGRFDFSAHREFRDAVDGALQGAGRRKIVVDLGGVDYLDSSALGMLLMLRDRAKSSEGTVALTNCRGAVKQVLDIANFGKLFDIT